MRPPRLTLAARFIFPVEGEPIADGLLAIEGGKIVSVEPSGGREADIDLGNVAITPGFVNAHTHLELSEIPRAGSPDRAEGMIPWLRRVIDQRRRISHEGLLAAVERNLRASIDAGTTLLADTTTAGLSWRALASSPIRSVVFAELIGLKRERGLQTNDEAWDWISSLGPEVQQPGAPARPGLSPHSPYSTSGWLYHRAAGSRLPLSTHLAEMPEELELLETRGGPLREFLEDLGAWDDEWEPIGPSPADYVRKGELRNADWLIAHGTYLDPSVFWQLRPEAAPNRHRVAVVYCPRTHARFGHAPHPHKAMLARGGVVCLGTDSLASSPSLSILDEARFLHARDDGQHGPLFLTMATLFGAWALRRDTITGSLKPGKSADLAVIALPDRDDDDPHSLLFDSDQPVVATMVEGDFVSGEWAGTSS